MDPTIAGAGALAAAGDLAARPAPSSSSDPAVSAFFWGRSRCLFDFLVWLWWGVAACVNRALRGGVHDDGGVKGVGFVLPMLSMGYLRRESEKECVQGEIVKERGAFEEEVRRELEVDRMKEMKEFIRGEIHQEMEERRGLEQDLSREVDDKRMEKLIRKVVRGEMEERRAHEEEMKREMQTKGRKENIREEEMDERRGLEEEVKRELEYVLTVMEELRALGEEVRRELEATRMKKHIQRDIIKEMENRRGLEEEVRRELEAERMKKQLRKDILREMEERRALEEEVRKELEAERMKKQVREEILREMEERQALKEEVRRELEAERMKKHIWEDEEEVSRKSEAGSVKKHIRKDILGEMEERQALEEEVREELEANRKKKNIQDAMLREMEERQALEEVEWRELEPERTKMHVLEEILTDIQERKEEAMRELEPARMKKHIWEENLREIEERQALEDEARRSEAKQMKEHIWGDILEEIEKRRAQAEWTKLMRKTLTDNFHDKMMMKNNASEFMVREGYHPIQGNATDNPFNCIRPPRNTSSNEVDNKSTHSSGISSGYTTPNSEVQHENEQTTGTSLEGEASRTQTSKPTETLPESDHFEAKQHKAKSEAPKVDLKDLSCVLCHFEATSEKMLYSHFEGKKHKAKLKALKDWRCAICQIKAPNEELLNSHFAGKKHQATLAKLKVHQNQKRHSKDAENTKGDVANNAPKIVTIQVKGTMHRVLQKGNHLFCKICNAECNSNLAMASHLGGKKHIAMMAESAKNKKAQAA